MLISEIQKQVVEKGAAVLLRPRPLVQGEPRQYDVKPLFTGNKRGWTMLDLTTANALQTCYNALSEASQEKWNRISVFKLVDFAWNNVS